MQTTLLFYSFNNSFLTLKALNKQKPQAARNTKNIIVFANSSLTNTIIKDPTKNKLEIINHAQAATYFNIIFTTFSIVKV